MLRKKVLLWWVDSKVTQFLDLSAIPKASRFENASTVLSYKKRKENCKEKVNILAIRG